MLNHVETMVMQLSVVVGQFEVDRPGSEMEIDPARDREDRETIGFIQSPEGRVSVVPGS